MQLTEQQIDELLERVEAGSSTAAQRLVKGHRTRLRTMVASRLDRRLQARIDPSDVVQDVLLEAARRLPEYLKKRDLPFYPWLRQMAWDRLVELHHQHVRVQKRSVTRERVDAFELSDHSMNVFVRQLRAAVLSPSAEAIRSEVRQRIHQAMDTLDEFSREVLLMHYVERMKLREIAASLNLTESAVKSRHVRALQRLSRVIGDAEDYT